MEKTIRIKIIAMNHNGVRTDFEVNGYHFNTSNSGNGLYYVNNEIIPPEFFSLDQSTKSGRWKGIKKQFNRYWDKIWQGIPYNSYGYK